jgi:SAM-dependent methyltransferase
MTNQLDAQRAETFAERLFGAAGQAMDTFCVYLGDRLGLYRALAGQEPMTSSALAAATGIDERYAREWCEQQVVAGVLEVDDASAVPDARKFALPDEHAAALVDPDGAFSVAPMSRFVASLGQALPKLLEAFRTGGGVPWSVFGSDVIESQGDFNRPWLRSDLTASYLPSVREVHERLSAGGRVADIACGVGWAGLSIARDYPSAVVVGLDPDAQSIEMSRRLASDEGVSDRVTFRAHDCAQPLPDGPFDFAIMVESLHDVARPVDILSRVRESLAPRGVMIVADEKVGESFDAPGPNDGIFYGFSVLCCLAAGRAEEPSAATGTVMRPDTVRKYAETAGFSGVEVLDQIDHPLLRFYLLRP